MNSENLIHIRLDSHEALQSKKDILSTEISLIKIAQAIKRYKILRSKELSLKVNLNQKIKDTKGHIRKIKSLLPTLKIPKILKEKIEPHEKKVDLFPHEEKPKETIKETKPVKPQKVVSPPKVKKLSKDPEDSLEIQLREIQERLAKL